MLLGVHIALGSLALVAGAAVLVRGRLSPELGWVGLVYLWLVLGVCVTAVALVGTDPRSLWWLIGLALLTAVLASVGALAPRWSRPSWARAYAHGTGGSYIALLTATLVVSIDDSLQILAWILPTAVGVPLIERWVSRLRAEEQRMGSNRAM